MFSGSDSHSADLGKFALYSFIRPVLDHKTPKVYDDNDLLSAESWRSHSVTDGFKNGDVGSSSLAAKGFRSVRPNLQDKKSPTQVRTPTLHQHYFFILITTCSGRAIDVSTDNFICCLAGTYPRSLHSNWLIRMSITCPCPHPGEKVSTSHPLALILQITAPLLP